MALPAGTVTFLFSDVEGSAQLARQLRDRYADVLADHVRVLWTAFQAQEGHEIDTQGDSFFFASPRAIGRVSRRDSRGRMRLPGLPGTQEAARRG